MRTVKRRKNVILRLTAETELSRTAHLNNACLERTRYTDKRNYTRSALY